MTQEQVFAKWLKVMRNPVSGKHTGSLESVTEPCKRCCLGHLCAAIAPYLRNEQIETVYYADKAGVLPDEVAELANISRYGTFIHPIKVGFDDRLCCSLVDLNDRTTVALHEIANIIEREYKAGNFAPFRADKKEELFFGD